MHHLPDQFRDEPLPDEFLRLGLRFSDGRAATNVSPPFWSPEVEPAGLLLLADGGGGGARRYDMTYWVWPLPPSGLVTFVCEWPAFGIEESRADIDAQFILQAAARATPLWPENEYPEKRRGGRGRLAPWLGAGAVAPPHCHVAMRAVHG